MEGRNVVAEDDDLSRREAAMNDEKNQYELLSESIRNFQKLNEAHEKETKYMKQLYESIKDQCLVLVYMSPRIKNLITEEEMSGFIIYLEERLKPILLAFNPEKSCFETYITKVVSFRALNYLSKKIRAEKMDFALAKYTYQEEQIKALESQWLMANERYKEGSNYNNTVKILRYLCHIKPSFQKRLFIFLISIFPYLMTTTKEKICKDFNFDLEQTFQIYNRVIEKASQKAAGKREQKYLEKRNRSWSRFLYAQEELELIGETSGEYKGKNKLEKQIEFYKRINGAANSTLNSLRKSLNYVILAKELNMPTGTLSSITYSVRNLLEAIRTKESNDISGGLLETINRAEEVEELKRFEPFLEFGIKGEDELQEE